MFVWLMNLVQLTFLSSLFDITDVLGFCSPACISCTNDTCVVCDVGSYLESGSCLSCPERCTSCFSSDVCFSCTDGYFGLSCEKSCISSKCVNMPCNKDSGICLHGCIEGYFLSGSSCYPCGANCNTCVNFSDNCLECKDGFYGPSCRHPCSNCKNGICTKDNCMFGCADGFWSASEACNICNKNCISCSLRYDNCHACVDGYFGLNCEFICRDCRPCNQNGSCPGTTMRPLTMAITSISSLSSTSQLSRSTSVESPNSPSQSTTTTDSNIEGGHQQKQPMDSTIIYSVGGGVVGFFVIVMVVVVVFVAVRWSRIKQTSVRINSHELKRDGAWQDYTTLAMRCRNEDGHLYSRLDNTNNIVTMETTSTTRDPSGQETHMCCHRDTWETLDREFISMLIDGCQVCCVPA